MIGQCCPIFSRPLLLFFFFRLWTHGACDDRGKNFLHPFCHHRDPLHAVRHRRRRPDHGHACLHHVGQSQASHHAMGGNVQVSEREKKNITSSYRIEWCSFMLIIIQQLLGCTIIAPHICANFAALPKKLFFKISLLRSFVV